MKNTRTYAARLCAAVGMLIAAGMTAAHAGKAQVYVLNGYNLSGIPGVDAQALTAKLKHRAGARITRASIAEDRAIVEKELEARHIPGRLFTTLAEKKGHVWIIFDVLKDPTWEFYRAARHLEAQHFDGNSRLSGNALAAATGLQRGEILSPEKASAAQRGIVGAYAKVFPGKKVGIACKMQGKPNGGVALTWTIREPK